MSETSPHRNGLFVKGARPRWIAAGLAALGTVALAGCGPDSGASSAPEASSAPSAAASSSAAASANMTASNAPAPSSAPVAAAAAAPNAQVAAAPVCPKVVQPACPTPASLIGGQPKVLAGPMSPATRRLWSHTRRVREARFVHHASRHVEHREPAAPAVEDRWSHINRSDSGSRQVAGAQVASTETSRLYQDGRMVVREREVRPGCPRDCGGHRDFDMAGIDARGYLVWPGKTEY